MHPRLHHLLIVPVILGLAFVPHAAPPGHSEAGESAEAEERDHPSDYFYYQRAMRDGTIPTERIAAAFEQLQFERALSEQQLTTSSAQDWVPIGPFAIGGRVNAVVAGIGGAPAYVGAANG